MYEVRKLNLGNGQKAAQSSADSDAEERAGGKQHGLVGYTVERERRFVYRDGTERVEKSTDHYPPTAEIFLVPPGIDEEMLLAGLDQGAEAEEGEDGEVFAAAPYDLPPIEDLPAANPPSQALLRAPTRLVIRGQ